MIMAEIKTDLRIHGESGYNSTAMNYLSGVAGVNFQTGILVTVVVA